MSCRQITGREEGADTEVQEELLIFRNLGRGSHRRGMEKVNSEEGSLMTQHNWKKNDYIRIP